ncbi:hypothetical protein KCP69_25610 [Salmonella enterica subsp. enterica]|nr:hypothetical protein KCP69_25610 [Salmonella enterica subsp. enterica]
MMAYAEPEGFIVLFAGALPPGDVVTRYSVWPCDYPRRFKSALLLGFCLTPLHGVNCENRMFIPFYRHSRCLLVMRPKH